MTLPPWCLGELESPKYTAGHHAHLHQRQVRPHPVRRAVRERDECSCLVLARRRTHQCRTTALVEMRRASASYVGPVGCCTYGDSEKPVFGAVTFIRYWGNVRLTQCRAFVLARRSSRSA